MVEVIDTGWLDANRNKKNLKPVRQIDGSPSSVTWTQSQTQSLATLEYPGEVPLTDVTFPILVPKALAIAKERLLI